MSTLAIRRRAVPCAVASTILLALAAAPAPASAACRGAAASPAALGGATLQAAVVCEVNRARRRHGLARVSSHPRLRAMAGRYARAMVAGRFFGHVSPGGSTLGSRLRASGYAGRTAGEVLAWGRGGRATPRAAVRMWLRSAPHRRVLLGRNYRDIGVGVVLGSPYGGGIGSATYAANLGGR